MGRNLGRNWGEQQGRHQRDTFFCVKPRRLVRPNTYGGRGGTRRAAPGTAAWERERRI